MNRGLSAGDCLSHYRIVSRIGVGGTGEVYLAEDIRFPRIVALKVLPEAIAADPSSLLRFERETRIASVLNHPNIATTFEFGSSADMHYLASELVQGETLRERLDRSRFTVAETLDITVQVASALQVAHEVGIVHRAIKPENVRLREDGYVKVLDFGLSKLLEEISLVCESDVRKQLRIQDGVTPETLAYMSPEQARGEAVDGRCDVWSLGCVIYELLTQQPPFRGHTVTDMFKNIIHFEPKAMQSQRPDIPAELERIVQETLRKNTNDRYQSARALLEDVKQLQTRLLGEAKI